MAEERAQRRLAAILAADVVGYSRLIEQDELGTLTALKERRRTILKPLVAEHHGRIVKVMGDGVLVEFGSAVNAVACAVELRKRMAAANDGLPEDQRVTLRIGINLGDVVVEGGDLYGDGVNVAARLQEMAEPGSICLSGTVREHIDKKLVLALDDLGPREIKNMARPVHVFRIAVGDSPAPESGGGSTSKPSIAVLPFTNMSGDPQQQYFSDGITEDIITELSRYRSLAVRARHSSFALRGQSSDAAEVGRKLAVDYVLDGSVARAADEVRVTVRLSEAESGSQLWAERYVRKPQDLFVVQDDVVRTIVATLVGRLEDAGAQRARRKHPGSLAAYDCLLRGIQLHNRMTPEDEPVARKMLEQAIALDPELAPAHSWLAVSYMVDWFDHGSREAFDHALVLAGRAVELDDDDGRCHATLGYISLYHRQFERAEFHADRAIALTPNDFRVICGKGVLLAYLGEHGAAVDWLTTAARLNPYPPEWYGPVVGMAFYSARRYAEALGMLAGGRSWSSWSSMYLAACLARLNRLDEARAGIAKWSAECPALSIVEYARNEPFKNGADLEHLLDGLRKAGLPE
jgi:TolB-like protein/class 3 adenylate cyclase